MAAMLGSSLALSISDIPFDGPIAGVQVGRVNGEYVLNYYWTTRAIGYRLKVAGTKKRDMVESVKEVSKQDMLGNIIGLKLSKWWRPKKK